MLYVCFWLLTLSWTTSGILSVPVDKFILNEATPQCEDKGEILFCDLKNLQENEVYMERLKDSKFKKVFIYSATNLYLADDVCVDVSLHNVKNARVDKTDDGSCNQDYELSATKSEFSEIYLKANKLHLEECKVDKLVAESKLAKLTILKSQIQELNVVGGLADNTTALIEDSQVKTLAKLTVESGSKLLLRKSRVDIIETQGLFINQGSVTFEDCTIRKTTYNKLMFGEFQGSFSLSGYFKLLDESQKFDPYPLLFWIFFIWFIVSTITFIIIYLDMKDIWKIPKLRRKTANTEEEKPLNPDEIKEKKLSFESHLKKLQDLFSQFESFLTGGNDNEQTQIPNYTKGQRQKDEKSFLENLKNLINSVNAKVNNLEDLNKRAVKVFDMNEETKALKENTDYPGFYDNLKNLNESVKDNLVSTKDSIEKQEVDLKKLIDKMNELKNPKNTKEKECCEHITWFNDIIDNVSDLQLARLQHYQFFLSIIIQSTKDFLFSWLHFQIYYTKFDIAELKNNLR